MVSQSPSAERSADDPALARSVIAPPSVARAMAVDPGLRHRMVSEVAFNLYAHRGCADGYALDDWLQAECIVDARIARLDRDEAS